MIASFFTSILLGGLLTGTTPDPITNATKKTSSEKSEWISLFNGKNTKGWHSYGKETVGKAWKVVSKLTISSIECVGTSK